jgi:hypothetical protein
MPQDRRLRESRLDDARALTMLIDAITREIETHGVASLCGVVATILEDLERPAARRAAEHVRRAEEVA